MEVLRYADGLEAGVCAMWLSLAGDCDLPEAVPAAGLVERFGRALPAVLSRYTVFSLGLLPAKEAGKAPQWVRLGVPAARVPVEERVWPADLPGTATVPAPPGLVDASGHPGPLYRVALAPEAADAAGLVRRVRLWVAASHALCDGRTLASLFAVVRSALPGATPCALPDAALPPFGQAGNYAPGTGAHYAPAALQPSAPGEPPLLPCAGSASLAEAVCEYVVSRGSAAHLRGALRARGASVQGLLLAAVARALRTHAGAARSVRLYANVPTDTRALAPATPAFRARSFFCGANSCFVDCTLDKEEKDCKEEVNKENHAHEQLLSDATTLTRRVREACAREDCCALTVVCAAAVDAASGAMGVPAAVELLASAARAPLFTASHIGRVDAPDAPVARPRFLALTGPVPPAMLAVYAYSGSAPADTPLCVSLLHASTLPPAFAAAVTDSLRNAFSLVANLQ